LPAATVNYYFADHLGTARIVTNSTGTPLDDSDFYPFGGERQYLSSSGNTYKFTGKERDAESGLDDFGARYYSSQLGRFLSIDPGEAKLHAPEFWNRYAYTLNNPLLYVDPTGRSVIDAGRIQLGKAIASAFAPEGSRLDVAAMLATTKGYEVVPYDKSVARNQQPLIPVVPDSGGGCVLGCAAQYREHYLGVVITLSFTYDKNDQLTGAVIRLERDPTASLIYSNPPPSRASTEFYPGLGQPQTEYSSVGIDPSILSGLSPAQLNAVATAANRQTGLPIQIKQAILEAIAAEGAKSKIRKDRKGTIIHKADSGGKPDLKIPAPSE
jgi:RHS repeat-associated protein